MRSYGAPNPNILWSLIALNVLVFAITLLRPEPVVNLLGLTPALLPERPWTIISAMFVHVGFPHILFNMISLYFLGNFLIRVVGEKNFLTVFFLGGLAGNILYFLLGPPNIPGVGASGGVFALGGALAMMIPRLPVVVFPIPFPVPLWMTVLVFFFLLIVVPMHVPLGIGWEAHLGGLLTGLAAGLILKGRTRIHYF